MKHQITLFIFTLSALFFLACNSDATQNQADGDIDSSEIPETTETDIPDQDTEITENSTEYESEVVLPECDKFHLPTSFGSCFVPENGWENPLPESLGEPAWIHVDGTITQKGVSNLPLDCHPFKGCSISIGDKPSTSALEITIKDQNQQAWSFYFDNLNFEVPLAVDDNITVDCLVKFKSANENGACQILKDGELVFFIARGFLTNAEWEKFKLADISLKTGDPACNFTDEGIQYKQYPIEITDNSVCRSIAPTELVYFANSGTLFFGAWYGLQYEENVITDYTDEVLYDFVIIKNKNINIESHNLTDKFVDTECKQ